MDEAFPPMAVSITLTDDIGRVRLRTQVPLAVDDYRRNTTTDPVTHNIVGAGMVLPPPVVEEHVPGRLSASTSAADSNVVRHPSLVTMRDRSSRGITIWFTGFSGSGKSTVAMLVEQRLLAEGRPAFVLDGDNLRHGLNADLGFSLADRAENLRRLAHVAALIAASGQVVLVPAISPLREHRELAQQVHREAGLDFVCVHVDTPLEVCEQRDAKGLYAKARAGVITEFTGIDSPYEPPHNPDLRLLPDRDARAQADQVIALLDGLRCTTAS
ncbi:MAG: adenylyl-sulfate kinase [Pseudonocardia sp.]